MRALYVRQGCLTLPRVASRNPPVCPPQTAIGRTAGSWLGSAPAPVAVFAIAPKTVSLLGSTAAPGCRVRRPRRTPFPSARCCQRGRWKPHARARALPPFVHPKLPLGLCRRPPRRTATNWDIAGERARPGCRFRRRAGFVPQGQLEISQTRSVWFIVQSKSVLKGRRKSIVLSGRMNFCGHDTSHFVAG